MAISTDIDWADSTLNLLMGCDGCELWNPAKGVRHCYAGSMTAIHAGRKGWPKSFGEPKLFLGRLDAALAWSDLRGKDRADKPWLNGFPRTIFLNDMGDTFTESLDEDWLAPYLEKMEHSKHIWIVLTKRPKRMARFFKKHPIPLNFWLCTSVTRQSNVKRIADLLKIEDAPILGVSVEPMLNEIDLSAVQGFERLQWVKIGGESGANARPCNIDWVKKLVRQCRKAEVPVFVKQLGTKPIHNGKRLRLKNWHGSELSEWPKGTQRIKVRQMPVLE